MTLKTQICILLKIKIVIHIYIMLQSKLSSTFYLHSENFDLHSTGTHNFGLRSIGTQKISIYVILALKI